MGRSRAKPEAKVVSQSEYARHRGVTRQSVYEAIESGRLVNAVMVVNGQKKISVAIADLEWIANTQPRVDYPAPPKRDAAVESDRDTGLPEGIPSYDVSRAIREHHAARRESALADVALIEADEKRGELVSVEQARADVIQMFTVVKTRILGVPTRLVQRLGEAAAAVVPTVEELLREALEELASGTSSADVEDDT